MGVKQLPHHPKVEGLTLAVVACTGRENFLKVSQNTIPDGTMQIIKSVSWML